MQSERTQRSPEPVPERFSVNAISSDAFARQTESTSAVDGGPQELLKAIRALRPEIVSRAQEMERSGIPAPDLYEKIAATGVFRMLQAREYGGPEYRLPDVIPIMEELAHADGSAAWNVLAGAEMTAIWQHFDRKVCEPILSRNLITRGLTSPRGAAVRVKDGFVLRGRWPLGSGAFPNEWFLLGAVILGDGSGGSAEPSRRLAVFAVPAHYVRVLETWDAMGLRSTMSNDVVVDEVFVPEAQSLQLPWPDSDGPTIGRLPDFLLFGPFHCGVVLGIARGALDDLTTLAKSKRVFLNPGIKMAQDPVFQDKLGRLETRLSAARSLAVSQSEAVWALAAEKKELVPLIRARSRSVDAHVHEECMAIVSEVFSLSGTNVVYNTSPLQRRFRDLRTVCQHVCASADLYRPYGALTLGEAPPATYL